MAAPPITASHAIDHCTQIIASRCPDLADRCAALRGYVRQKDEKMAAEYIRLTHAISTSAWNKFSMLEQRQIMSLVELLRD